MPSCILIPLLIFLIPPPQVYYFSSSILKFPPPQFLLIFSSPQFFYSLLHNFNITAVSNLSSVPNLQLFGANKGQFEVDLHIVWWPDWYQQPPVKNPGSASE